MATIFDFLIPIDDIIVHQIILFSFFILFHALIVPNTLSKVLMTPHISHPVITCHRSL